MEDGGHPVRLLDRVREAIRVRHYSIRTEHTYIGWIRRYVLFYDRRHPAQMGESEVARFLTHLAVDEHVAPATQDQALNALVFLIQVRFGQAFAGGAWNRTGQKAAASPGCADRR